MSPKLNPAEEGLVLLVRRSKGPGSLFWFHGPRTGLLNETHTVAGKIVAE